jgi:hypothetical protein
MEEWTLREQYEVQQLQGEQLVEELLQGEQPVVPLNRKVPLNGALEGPLKETPAHPLGGKGAQTVLSSIPHPRQHPPPPSQEIPAHPLGGKGARTVLSSIPHPRRHPPPGYNCSSGILSPLPGSCSSQESPAHPPGGQLA